MVIIIIMIKMNMHFLILIKYHIILVKHLITVLHIEQKVIFFQYLIKSMNKYHMMEVDIQMMME